MDPNRLIDELHSDAVKQAAAKHEHIIRFTSGAAYEAALANYYRLNHLSSSEHISAVPIIRGFSCTINDLQKWEETSGIIVEQNQTVQVQFIPGMLPSFAESPTHPKKRLVIPWGIEKIKAHKLWKYTQGHQIRIGVIDTGVDANHPNLRHALGSGVNFVQRMMPPFDDNGHGTHIAGTIAASNKQHGVVGVSPRAIVHPVKSFDHKGTAYVSDIIHGLEWCIRNRMHVINMSFGMDQPSRALYEAVLSAHKAGIIIVASAGNNGAKDKIDYPARHKETIAIGASDQKSRIAKFSNRSSDIDLFAPGEKIESTWPGGQYRELSGSSMATAHVSGTIALMLSIRPQLRLKQIKSLLIRSAMPLRYKRKSSKLRELNAFRAFRRLQFLFLNKTKKTRKNR